MFFGVMFGLLLFIDSIRFVWWVFGVGSGWVLSSMCCLVYLKVFFSRLLSSFCRLLGLLWKCVVVLMLNLYSMFLVVQIFFRLCMIFLVLDLIGSGVENSLWFDDVVCVNWQDIRLFMCCSWMLNFFCRFWFWVLLFSCVCSMVSGVFRLCVRLVRVLCWCFRFLCLFLMKVLMLLVSGFSLCGWCLFMCLVLLCWILVSLVIMCCIGCRFYCRIIVCSSSRIRFVLFRQNYMCLWNMCSCVLSVCEFFIMQMVYGNLVVGLVLVFYIRFMLQWYIEFLLLLIWIIGNGFLNIFWCGVSRLLFMVGSIGFLVDIELFLLLGIIICRYRLLLGMLKWGFGGCLWMYSEWLWVKLMLVVYVVVQFFNCLCRLVCVVLVKVVFSEQLVVVRKVIRFMEVVSIWCVCNECGCQCLKNYRWLDIMLLLEC